MKRGFYLPHFSAGLLLIAIAAFLQGINAQSINAQSTDKNWVGSYEFFDAEKGNPRNQPGNFVTYTLTLSLKGDSLSARFTADGTQTSDAYECQAQSTKDSIKIFFEKDLNGMNESRFKPFKKGELLFTLTKTQVSNKSKYLYRAGGYEILPLSSASKKNISRESLNNSYGKSFPIKFPDALFADRLFDVLFYTIAAFHHNLLYFFTRIKPGAGTKDNYRIE